MSTISGYFLPNKIANSYVANERNNEGELVYEGAMQDVGIKTQSAIQSLSKTYSDTINNAYSQYLNSKQSILNSDMGQGYKEAYLQNQQEAFRQNVAQANLTSAETKQQLLQEHYKQTDAIGEAFQNEVINMDKVGTYLESYMNYLRTMYGNDGKNKTSYIDDLITAGGLSEVNQRIGIHAEDIYDELYTATPKGYQNQKGEKALGWKDWLKTQITNDKEQTWMDWYMGAGGYEKFKDAYDSGIFRNKDVAAFLQEQARKKEYETKKAEAQEKYNMEKYAAKQKYDTDYNAAKSEFDKKVEIDRPKLDYNFNDFSFLDFGEQGKDKAGKAISDLQNYAKSVGVSDEELLKIVRDYFGAAFTKKEYASLKNANSLDDYKKVIEKLVKNGADNSIYNKIEGDYRKIVNNVYSLAKSKFSFREFKYDDFVYPEY